MSHGAAQAIFVVSVLLNSATPSVAQPFGPPGVPSKAFPPLCSIAEEVKASAPRSMVLNYTDGVHERCASVVVPSVPSAGDTPMPVLFSFHGAGGNAGNFGGRKDRLGLSEADLAKKYGIAVVGGEALQWTGHSPAPPGPGPPGPVPAPCVDCFHSHGCTRALGEQGCLQCMKQHEFGPEGCAHICSSEHVPFPAAEQAVCGEAEQEVAGSDDTTGQRWRSLEEIAGANNPHLHGGQWLIPEIQTDETGLVCDWERNLDLVCGAFPPQHVCIVPSFLCPAV
jgi:hypothetical protein